MNITASPSILKLFPLFIFYFLPINLLSIFTTVYAAPASTNEYAKQAIPLKPNFDITHSSNNINSLFNIIDSYKSGTLEPKASTYLSLNDCIKLAFQNSPELLSAIASVRETGDNFTATKNSWYPTASLSASGVPTYQFQSSTSDYSYTNPFSYNRTQKNYTKTTSASLNATLQWNFLDFSRQPNINASASQYDAQKYVLYSTIRRIISNIEVLYTNLQAQKELIDSYSEIVKTLRVNANSTSARQKVGLVSILDVYQSDTQLLNSATQLVGYIQQYYDSAVRLTAILSIKGDNIVFPSESSGLRGVWQDSLQNTIESAQKNNDQILQTLKLASSSRWQGISFLNQTLPQFSIGISGGYNPSLSNNSYTEINSFVSSEKYTQSSEVSNLAIFLGFNWTFFQGGVNTSNASAQFNRSQALSFDAINQKNQLAADVRSYFNALESSRISYNTSKAAITSARGAYSAALARLSVGLTDVTTVNQTVQSYQSSLQELSSSVQKYNTALSLLYRDSAIWPPHTIDYVSSFVTLNRF